MSRALSSPFLCLPTDYIFSFASTATKKISDSVVETAQTIKKTVEEGKIDNIIDKVCFPILLWQILKQLCVTVWNIQICS